MILRIENSLYWVYWERLNPYPY